MSKINDWLARRSRAWIFVASLVLVGMLGALDYLTGPQIGFSIFYLVPVWLATWYAARSGGFVIAAVSAIAWFVAETLWNLNYTSAWTPYWNAAIRLGFFFIVACLLTSVKRLTTELQSRVEQGTSELKSEVQQRRRAEDQLRVSEESYRQLFENSPDPLWVFDQDTLKFLAVNGSAVRHYGYSHQEFLAMTVKDIRPSEDVTDFLKRLEEWKAGPEFPPPLRIGIHEHLKKDGVRITAEITRSVVNYHGRPAVLVHAKDVTDRFRLRRQVLEISDREQARIGQDLHDGLCQHLVGVAFAANTLEEKLSGHGAAEVRDAREIAMMLDDAITQARKTVRGLYPVKLEAEGLASALGELAANTRGRHGLDCRFDYPEPVLMSSDVVAMQLYRIAQEAVLNAVKHANPEQIIIRLTREGDNVEVRVLDDGQGVPEPLVQSGLGLHIIEYRSRAIGGRIHIRKRVEGGTEVLCSVPEKNLGSFREKRIASV